MTGAFQTQVLIWDSTFLEIEISISLNIFLAVLQVET